MVNQVHETAVVEDGVELGENTRVWHFSHIMTGAKIGRGCNIGQNVFIDRNVEVGNEVKIQNNVSIYAGVIIEDLVFLGPSVVFTNVINPRSFIDRKHEIKPTRVCRGATLGANATILCGITIGAFAMIGAGAVVTRSVPSFASMVGNPAKQQGWVSETGLKLQFREGRAVCPEESASYQLVDNTVSKIYA